MLTVGIAGLPGVLFIATLSFALILPLGGTERAFVGSALLGLLILLVWTLVLPPLFARRALGRLSLSKDPLLDWGWKRAFDGLPLPNPQPRIWVWNTPVPAFLVMAPPILGPSLLVSRGWLFEKGESAFRAACREASARLQDSALSERTRNAFLLAWMTRQVHPAFWSTGFLTGSEASAEKRLSPLSLTWGLLILLWMRWIIRWSAPQEEPDESSRFPLLGRMSVDEIGRTDPESEILCQFLSLERTAVRDAVRKSILSWLPARW
jgi:hypothetical protein